MYRAQWLVLMIATTLMLQSCTSVEVPFPCTSSSPSESSSLSEPLDIVVDVDGSSSMLGYVKDPDSRYVETLKLLDDTLSLGGLRPETSSPSYARSGNVINRSDFRKAQLPVFYNETDPKFPNIASPIQDSIIAPGKQDKFLVIVTDLGQAGGDVKIINEKIQDTYLNNKNPGYAVGILAIKSEFIGQVYLPGQQNTKKFTFPNKQSADSLRPFYVIFIGRDDDIIKYFQTLQTQGKNLLEGSEFTLFSPKKIVNPIAYLDKDVIKKPSKEQAIDQLWKTSNNSVKVQAEDQNSQLWEIPSQQTEAITIEDSVNLMSFNKTAEIDINSIDTIQYIKVFEPLSKEFKDSKQVFKDDSSIQKILNIGQWNIVKNSDNEQEKLNFVTTIQADKFPTPGVYLFEIDVVVKDLQEEKWWQDWSWTTGKDNAEDGSKTHNLLSFLRGLKTITTNVMAENPPKIGHFCYVIQKK